jgi:hypothetical protein
MLHDEVELELTIGELEAKWLWPDGEIVTSSQLSNAMEEWLWRAKAVKICIKEGRPVLQKMADPLIISVKGTSLINRAGDTTNVPRGFGSRYKPGDVVTVDEYHTYLRTGRADAKQINFGMIDAFSPVTNLSITPTPQLKQMALKMLDEFKDKWPALTTSLAIRMPPNIPEIKTEIPLSDSPIDFSTMHIATLRDYAKEDAMITFQIHNRDRVTHAAPLLFRDIPDLVFDPEDDE